MRIYSQNNRLPQSVCSTIDRGQTFRLRLISHASLSLCVLAFYKRDYQWSYTRPDTELYEETTAGS